MPRAGPLCNDMDVVNHEFTHAVTQYESNLVYNHEPGALSESYSDIFSAACESWSTGTWSMGADTWKIAEDILTPGTPGDALRYMDNPTQDGASADYYPERYTGTSDNGGVHINSGIPNLAFALLSKGGLHPRGKTSITVTGIGVERAGRIFYKAQTDYFTSSTTFAQAKAYTEQVTNLLYGSTVAASVTQAWQAVGVGTQPPPLLQHAARQWHRAAQPLGLRREHELPVHPLHPRRRHPTEGGELRWHGGRGPLRALRHAAHHHRLRLPALPLRQQRAVHPHPAGGGHLPRHAAWLLRVHRRGPDGAVRV